MDGIDLPDARGHIQAVGYDDKGRKQYRYHTAVPGGPRQRNNYEHMMEFARRAARAPCGGSAAAHGLARADAARRCWRRLSTFWKRPDPGGQRRLCQGEQELRADHAARPPRKGGWLGCVSSSRARAARLAAGPVKDRRSPGHRRPVRTCPASAFQYLDDEGELHGGHLGRRKCLPEGDHRRGHHRQGLPHLGRHGAGGDGAARIRGLPTARRDAKKN